MMRIPRFAALWIGFFTWAILWNLIYPKTNTSDVSALNVMYSSLNSPSKLSGWKSSGGDPCGDSWQGITCSGSSVTEINLSGLGLTGSMGYQLSSLTSVTYFDLSKNNLKGDIPYQLPPNALHIDLSKNGFTNGVPYSISQMSDIKYLNLGHNKLNGQLSDMFGQLPKISTLDLSYNSLTGNLPRSFGSLSSLSTMYLQNNQFTGPIDILADLPLDDLNISNNKFTGWIPDVLKNIKNINTDGNSWSSGPAPPGSHHSRKSINDGKGGKQYGLSGVAIAGIVVGTLLAAVILIAMFLRKSSSPSTNYFDEERFSRHRSFTSLTSQEQSSGLPADMGKSFKGPHSFDSTYSISMKALESAPPLLNGSKPPPPIDRLTSLSDNSFANHFNARRSTSFRATCYSLADLQTATGNFATGRLLGLGSIGRVYRAKYPDGKVLAIKKIDSSLFIGGRVENFSDVVSSISGLHHPNIAEFLGYCSDQGHNMLVYEYFRNGSLHEFLHLSDDYSKPFTWNTRVRTALGTARAIEYLHEACSPSLLHKNIKSSNILLDNELNPRLSECGLAPFYQCSSQNLGVGYNPPECTKPSAYTMKSDVYSFGVVMLELLTGRMPFDSSRTRSEQSLVQWASPQLHDNDALEKMVDPALRGLYPPKSISRFADTISLCVQSEVESRPPITEVVQALLRLVHSTSVSRGGYDLSTSSRRTDDSDYY